MVPPDRLAAGLQYGSTAGYEPFVAWIESLQAYAHRRHKGEGWRVSVGSGAQDLLYKVCSFRVVLFFALWSFSHA